MASQNSVPITEEITQVKEVNNMSGVHCEGGEIDLKVGIIVLNEDAAYNLYNRFAISKGFSIRRGKKRYKLKTNVVCERTFYCSKEGQKQNGEQSHGDHVERLDTRTGCKALARFKVEDGVWELVHLINEHNHNLAPPEQHHLLRSARNIPETSKCIIRSMSSAGIRPMKAYRYLAKEAGGVRNVGFTKIDHLNLLTKDKSEKLGAGDAQSLINHFKLKQAKNPMFFYSVQVDDEKRLKNFFWRDGLSKIDYECFGDVVVFDTTYRTNKYNMICAPFVGVNHHWKNVFFGCAFLSDEKKTTFVWLLEAFKSAMGKAPKTIFTDQDHAMKSAIKQVFPNTQHRLCIWHILKNAGSNISHLYTKPEFKVNFNKLFYSCESSFEFEIVWKELVKDWGADKEKWLKKLYDIRENWCSCFSLNTFSAGIQSTQRSESTNSVFQKMTCKTMTLNEFVRHYDQKVEEMRDDENSLDFTCDQGRPYMRVRCGLIEHATEVYTHRVFRKFQLEFLKSVYEQVSDYSKNGTYSSYILKKEGRYGTHLVEYNSWNGAIHCSCKMFESRGWLCSHALRVLNVKIGVDKIPEQYILQRWRKHAKNNIMKESFEPSIVYKISSKTIRLNKLMRKAFYIMNLAAEDEKTETIANESMDELLSYIGMFKENKKAHITQADIENEDLSSIHSLGEEPILDPPCKRAKGEKNTRIKGPLEKKKKKKGVKVMSTPPMSYKQVRNTYIGRPLPCHIAELVCQTTG